MEAIDILARVDAVDEAAGVGYAGQRQLHQDAVHLRVGIEPVDQGEQLRFSGARGQVEIECGDAHLVGRAALVAHV